MVPASAGDLMIQLESIDYLRRHRQMSAAKTQLVLVSTLDSLLS